MVKQFTVNCNFKTAKAPVTFYIGDPSDDNHPIHFQSKWLSEKKGGTVPQEILDSFTELQKIATKNHVSFQDLCSFVIEELNNNDATIAERERIHKNLTIVQKREEQKQLSAAQAAPTASALTQPTENK
jgi:hypothetical protein